MQDNNKISFNDTPEMRGFTSENFSWILDKESGISCAWGKTAKDNPDYDPIGPEEIIWSITDFELTKYIKYFNFLTNIHEKNQETNEVSFIKINTYNSLMKIKESLICMSTFGNIIFNINLSELTTKVKEIKKFITYIKLFNINPKFILNFNEYNESNLKEIIKTYSEITNNIIILIEPKFFNYETLLNLLNNFHNEKFNCSIELNINNDNYGQAKNLIEKITDKISITVNFNNQPYVSLEKFLKFQNFCKDNNLINIILSQCAKLHFGKRVVGSIIHEIPCPAAKFSCYIENNFVYPCKYNKNNKVNLDDCNSIHDFWLNQYFSVIRNKLNFQNSCIGVNEK